MKWSSPQSSIIRLSNGGLPSSSSVRKRWRPVLLNIKWITEVAAFSKTGTPKRNGTCQIVNENQVSEKPHIMQTNTTTNYDTLKLSVQNMHTKKFKSSICLQF